MTITHDGVMGHGYPLPHPWIPHMRPIPLSIPLLISGGHHWRPVQTCSLKDLLTYGSYILSPCNTRHKTSEISLPSLRRFGDDVGVGVSSCVSSPAAAAVDAARELCCMLASHSKRSTFSPCKPKWSLLRIVVLTVVTIFERYPTTNVSHG